MSAPQRAPIERHVWLICATVVAGSVMPMLDTTIVNVGVVTLGRELHSSLAEIQWVVTSYMLAMAGVIPLCGWAAERFDTKRTFVAALGVFTTGSMLCGVSTSTVELVIFRVVQGIGGGMIFTVGTMIVAATAGREHMGRVMSAITAPAMLAPILGPTLGGLILQHTSWRWMFYVNVPVAVFAAIAAVRVLPTTKRSATRRALDVRGFALMITGVPLLTFGLAQVGATDSLGSLRVVIPCVGGVALIAVFAMHALQTQAPLLNLRLYRLPTFATASATLFLTSAAQFAGIFLLPLYWQEVRHEDLVTTGLFVGAQGLGFALAMPVTGRLADRLGGGPLALVGIGLTAVATVPLALAGTHTSVPLLCAATCVRGVGIGLTSIPVMSAAYASLERSELMDAPPQLQVVQRIGGSLGTALLAVVLQRALAGGHTLPGAVSAYGLAFWFAVTITAVALVPATLLLRAERAARSNETRRAVGEAVKTASA